MLSLDKSLHTYVLIVLDLPDGLPPTNCLSPWFYLGSKPFYPLCDQSTSDSKINVGKDILCHMLTIFFCLPKYIWIGYMKIKCTWPERSVLSARPLAEAGNRAGL